MAQSGTATRFARHSTCGRSGYNLCILLAASPARAKPSVEWRRAILFASLAALCLADTITPPRTPLFSDFPFDQWAAAPDHTVIKWQVQLPNPQLSVHQRLLERVQTIVPGGELAKRRGRGELVLLVRFENSMVASGAVGAG